MSTRKVAVCCSGGDAPGMNPWLRATTRLGLCRPDTAVLGIKDGFAGLVRLAESIASGEQALAAIERAVDIYPGRAGLDRRGQDLVLLDHPAVSGLCRRGGTVLGAGRCPAFHDPAIRRRVADVLQRLGIRTLMVCGGNGSLSGAASLAGESDLEVIGVPASIDNDVPGTETALGVDTAVNNIVWAVERFADTACSHHRIMVIETMGRDSGNLARMAGLAGGAELVLTPERGRLDQAKMQAIANRLENLMLVGHNSGIVLVAEGVEMNTGNTRPATALAAHLREYFARPESPFPQLETRMCVLGHLQRGGSPTAADRLLAAQFADAAWRAIDSSDRPNGYLSLQHGRFILQPFERLTTAQPPATDRLYEIQKAITKGGPRTGAPAHEQLFAPCQPETYLQDWSLTEAF